MEGTTISRSGTGADTAAGARSAKNNLPEGCHSAAAEGAVLHKSALKVALLINSLSPHNLPVCEHISRSVGEFRAFLSADVDAYHGFSRPKATFRLTVQRSFNGLRFPRRAYGHWQRSELHVPYDTYLQLRAYEPDLILSVQLGLRTVLAVLYRMRRPQTKLILWATLSKHTEARRHWLRRLFRGWIIRHIDGAFVNGHQGEEYLHLLGYRGKVETVPYAIDEAYFGGDLYRPQQDAFRLIYAGQLVPQKGLREFCTVLNRWCAAHPKTQVAFTLVGDGPSARVLRAMPTEPNLTITILPTMDQKDLADQYRSADLLAFPTLGDEWGVVVNEAMIAGLPVLGSLYSQAVVEMVEEGVTGWLYDPCKEEDIYGALERCFASTVVELGEMSQRVRQRIAKLSPFIVANNALQAIGHICQGTL